MNDYLSIWERHQQNKDNIGWFEELYTLAKGNPDNVPWARLHPNLNLIQWQEREQRDGKGKTALVIGCGLGDDAEFISREMGYDVTAFDISETAVKWCKERWQKSTVDYRVMDLFALPDDFTFDFVLEAHTVQSLPPELHHEAFKAVSRTVGGELLLICRGRDDNDPAGTNPPWRVAKGDLKAQGLTVQHFEDYNAGHARRFRVLYRAE